MLPQVGQGAIAVECRAGDDSALGLLEDVNDVDAFTALRTLRDRLAGGKHSMVDPGPVQLPLMPM